MDEQIKTVYQPIVSLRDGSVLGYEALSRGPGGADMESPEKIFAVAEECGRLWELERVCHAKALQGMKAGKEKGRLFLNITPAVLEDARLKNSFTKEHLKGYGLSPEDITFEITEKSAILNNGEFKKIVQYYKAQNFKIAIDDTGAGYAGLTMISDVQPHYLKLDISLVRDVDKDTVKQALIKSMMEYARITGTYLIAEGIEPLAELRTVIHIGVQYGQGFFIGRPDAKISPVSPEVTAVICDINTRRNHMQGQRLSDVYIGNLCVDAMVVDESFLISEAYDCTKKMERLPGFCVMRDGEICGVVTKNSLNATVSGVYGYSLFSRHAIGEIMDTDFISVDFKTPVNAAGKLAMTRPEHKVYDFITVTAEGRYYGIVTIRDLLERMIEIEVTAAAQLNPLTMLPGNRLIERELDEVLRSPDRRCVVYFDIDNFKAYNDVYGFEKGDQMIAYLAKLIRTTVGEKDFTGHLGGDDFVSIVDQENAEEFCKNIIREFTRGAAAFLNEQDVANGFITACNRRGQVEQIPLVALSVAALSVWEGRFANVFELSAEASRIKKECKMIAGGAYIIH